jgi:hypothetical protein
MKQSQLIKLLFSVSFVAVLFGCEFKQNKATSENSNSYQVKTIRHAQGWGYEIKKGEKTIIKQLTIPSISGKRVFTSEKDAVAVGDLMVKKIENNIFPPSISKKELDSLSVSY